MTAFLAALLGACVGVALAFAAGLWLLKRAVAHRRAKAKPGPHDNATVSLAEPVKVVGKDGKPVWYPAMVEYIKARLEANGNKPINLKEALAEFARWHGPKNLDKGILRPLPPPIPGTPQTLWMPQEIGEA